MLRIEVLVSSTCEHARATLEIVREVAGRLAPGAGVEERCVETSEEAERLAFPGSPTVRIDGEDIEGEDVGPPRLTCRDYGGSGVPATWLLEAALLRALAPAHILFLCVANSARSQMAEGIARSLAPEGVRVSSAGSEPSSVRPEAIEALREIGVDIRHQRSHGVDEVQDGVEAVITLCAEEVCPVWLGHAPRVHWALPDPAGVQGTEDERLDAFRAARDELRRRLTALFRPPR